MKAANLKTVVIAVLCVLVAVQAAWIVHISPMPDLFHGPLMVKETRVAQDRSGFDVEFSAPVATESVAADAAASIDPEVSGRWVWENPYLLHFSAEQPLEANAEYTVTMAPSLGLEGSRTLAVRTGAFYLKEIELSEEAGNRPASAVIAATLSFSGPVSPEDLLEHVTLTDETDGSTVPLQIMTSWSSRRMELRSDAVDKTTEGRRYRLKVTKGLKRSGSPLALDKGKTADIDIKLDPVLTYQGADPWSSPSGGGIRLSFSTPMDPRSADAFITLTPTVGHTLSADGSQLRIDGDFTPGTTYAVSLRKGLAAADGATLNEAQTSKVTIPDIEPAADFVGSGMFLPRSRSAGLAIKAVNTDRVTVRVDRIYPNNLFAMLNEYGWRVFDDTYDYNGVPESLGGRLFEKTIAVSGKRNQTVTLPVTLGDVLDGKRHGLYKVGVSLPGQNGHKRWLVLSDIGLVAKKDQNKFTVWAVSNTTLKPMNGVRLTLVSDKNQSIARASTDANGTATLRFSEDQPDGAPYLILAEGTGGDFTFLLPSRFKVETTGLDVDGVAATPSGLRAYIYGERDLYRPGETLKGMAVVRTDSLSAPPSMPLVLIQHDPKGREVRKMRLKTDSRGSVAFDIPIPEYALTGGHSLTLKAGDTVIGSRDFKVEEFIPDRIKVEVGTGRERYAPGQSIEATVASSYLFGPPAAKLPVSVHALLRATPYMAKGYEDYQFGNPDLDFEPQEFASQDKTLDEKGNAAFALDVPEGLTPPAALEAVIYGRVSETGGRGVTAAKRVTVHAYPYYIGIKELGKNGYEPRKPIRFQFVTADTKGELCKHGELTATFYRDRWRTVVRKSPSGGYLYESVNDPQSLSSVTIPAGAGEGSVEFTPPSYGSFRVEIHSAETGAAARSTFYCGGWGYSPWALENPARIELAADKKQYQPGDVAVIQLRTPFAGKALVTVEGNFINDTRVVDISGNTGEVRFPVKAAYAPNVHVTAMLLRKAAEVGEGSVGRAFGAIPLLVDNLSNKMDVSVSAPAEVRPETDLTVEAHARPGSLVTIAAVDEGILQLSGGDDPDPFDYFYARRALGVTSYDTFAMLYPDLARVMNAAEAGGGMAMMAESKFMRTEGIRRVKPVSFWSGPLVAGADGIVNYSMALPDFQGALRIVAVSLDGKRFGTGRTMTRVRAPLAVTPTLPRFMATKDAIEMPVTVRNDTGKAAGITVSTSVEGAASSTARPMTLQLEDAAEQTIYLPITAADGAGGKATVSVTAASGEEHRTVSVELPVRPAVPFRREIEFGTVKGTENTELVSDATGYVPGTVTRSVTIGRMPLARFTGKLEYLLRYPYGCAEQTASRAFPLIRFGALAKALAPDLVDRKGPSFMVQSALMRLQSMQTGNGGFAFWPGMDKPEPWVSAYVTHFLLEATEAGYASPGMLERALGYMNRLATERGDLTAASYALFDLAKAQQPDRGSMDELRDKRAKKMTSLGRTLLACAYALSGDMQSFNALLADKPEVTEGRQPGGRMGSGLRDAALMLLALSDAAPTDRLVPELAERVSRLMSVKSYGTTQENALAFAALGKALAKSDTGPISGMLVSGETQYPFVDADTYRMNDVPAAGPMTASLASDDATAYWSVTTRGVPLAESVKPVSHGIEVRRSFLDRDGMPVDVTSLEQGALVIMKTEVRPVDHPVENVVVQMLLPAGLEVENPRLESSEVTAFAPDKELPITGHQDMRDDRVLFFTDLEQSGWHAGYTQLRAVTPGTFALPPVQAEAMYDPSVVASGELGTMSVIKRP